MNLYQIGLRSGLNSFVVINPTPHDVIVPLSLMGTALRAILGAVWQELQGLLDLKRAIEKVKLGQCEDWRKGNGNL